MLSKHDSSSQSGNTERIILHYYKQNKLAIIIIYNEQSACRLIIVTSQLSTNAGNRGLEVHEYHTLCAAYRMTSLNTTYQETLYQIAASIDGILSYQRRSMVVLYCSKGGQQAVCKYAHLSWCSLQSPRSFLVSKSDQAATSAKCHQTFWFTYR